MSKGRSLTFLVFVFFALTSCQEDISYLVEESSFKIEEGDYLTAIGYLDEVIDREPSLEPFLLRGKAYLHLGDLQKAAINFTQASILAPDDYRAWMNLGNIDVEVGRFPHAITNYNKAIASKNNEAKLYMNRGNVAFQVNNMDLAWSDYSKVLELDPDETQAIFNKGRVAYMRSSFDAALELFEVAQAKKFNLPETHYWLGVTHHQLGDAEKTCAYLEKSKDSGYFTAAEAYQTLCSQ